MNLQEQARVTEAWLGLASLYGRQAPNEAAVRIMLRLVADLPAEAVLGVLTAWAANPKNKSYPNPGEIIEAVKGGVNPDSMAREIAGRCVEAIKRFGWPQPEKAKEFIGPEGWSCIEGFGGWLNFCQNHGVEIDPNQFFAQARDRIRDQLASGGRQAINNAIERIEHGRMAEVIRLAAPKSMGAE